MPETMKALVKAKAEVGIWMEDVPIPKIEPNEVLIRVHRTSICGTDMHISQMGSVGPSKRAGADGHWPRIRR